MHQRLDEAHYNDENGNPAGGHSSSTGLSITWQNGPLVKDGKRVEPNGAFVETVIEAALGRLEYYQASKFACYENQRSIVHLRDALSYLDDRTRDREKRNVEGTHEL